MKTSEIKKYIDVNKFFDDIQRIIESYDTNPLDAVVHFCEVTGIELDVAAQLIKSNSKFKKILMHDGINLNMISHRE